SWETGRSDNSGPLTATLQGEIKTLKGEYPLWSLPSPSMGNVYGPQINKRVSSQVQHLPQIM
ncbi:MAG: hypothetical protein QOJ51_2833, partial [Acidobacteriaceae bacterium]|nr:hypothetical protein [Acidobacteriaceae bacterium]